MKKIILIDIISAFILLLFLYTSISKFAEHDKFRDALSSSPFLKPVANVIAWALPPLEIAVAILLFFPLTRLRGLAASFVLLLMFTAYLFFMILFASHLPCSCGGVLKNLTWPQHIIFNLAFAILSLTGMLLGRKKEKGVNRAPT